MPKRVRFTSNIKPARLPTCSVEENVEVIATGTGIANATSRQITPTDFKPLEFAVLKTLPFAVCQNAYRHSQWSDRFICAYDSVNHQSACQGDSGGPLVTRSDGILVGVSNFVSQGKLC